MAAGDAQPQTGEAGEARPQTGEAGTLFEAPARPGSTARDALPAREDLPEPPAQGAQGQGQGAGVGEGAEEEEGAYGGGGAGSEPATPDRLASQGYPFTHLV